MRSRRRRAILAAAAVVIGIVAGVVSVAAAGSTETLPSITAEELLTKMARSNLESRSVSGEISWQNALFGNLEVPADLAQMPAQSPLLSSGAGRLWASEAGMRIESQGSGGDQIAAVSKASRLAWTYDSASNRARRYEMSGDGSATPLPSPSVTTLAPIVVGRYLERLSPYATVTVAGRGTVAGRSAYVLRMVPVAQDTALESMEAAIDGQTMLPLRLEVFARGGPEPALRFGFDSISYEDVDASLYEFAAPEGAEVTTETIDPATTHVEAGEQAAGERSRASRRAGDCASQKLARRALLNSEEAQGLVDYELARARDYDARPLRWAYVLGDGGPLTAAGQPVFAMAGVGKSSTGPSSVLLYGSGFGAIALVQTRTTPALAKQLEQLPAQSATVNGAAARSVFTPLGGVVIWQHGETTLVAGGLVTRADLEAFARAVR